MISDERLSELEQVEGLADLVAEVRKLREWKAFALFCSDAESFSAQRHTVLNGIATQVEEKVGPVFGPTLAKMIRELPEEG